MEIKTLTQLFAPLITLADSADWSREGGANSYRNRLIQVRKALRLPRLPGDGVFPQALTPQGKKASAIVKQLFRGEITKKQALSSLNRLFLRSAAAPKPTKRKPTIAERLGDHHWAYLHVSRMTRHLGRRLPADAAIALTKKVAALVDMESRNAPTRKEP